MIQFKRIAVLVFFCVFFSACSNTPEGEIEDIEEVAQQLGDVMASIDEFGGDAGTFALLTTGASKNICRKEPKSAFDKIGIFFLPKAQAETCAAANTFSSCSNNSITRDFAGCTVFGALFNGTVAYTFLDAGTDNTCLMAATGDSIKRQPNFTVSGRRGATLTVSATGVNGQVLTKAGAAAYTFSSDGIRRLFTAGGATLFDFTTATTADITVTGNNRNNRTLTGGVLRITNNLTAVTCDFTPSALNWSSSCNCPTSGSWSATCSDGKSSSLTISGCGDGSFSLGEETTTVTFDRCQSI